MPLRTAGKDVHEDLEEFFTSVRVCRYMAVLSQYMLNLQKLG